VAPCNYVHAELGDVGDYVRPECITEQAKHVEYLGNMKLVVYMGEQVFNQQEYGSAAIETRSRFLSKQVDNTKPSWLDGRTISN